MRVSVGAEEKDEDTHNPHTPLMTVPERKHFHSWFNVSLVREWEQEIEYNYTQRQSLSNEIVSH